MFLFAEGYVYDVYEKILVNSTSLTPMNYIRVLYT